MTDRVGAVPLSLKFKHGTHTVFLFVDALGPFSKITEELLEVLRERYPDGLSVSSSRPDLTKIPAADQRVRVSYAVLNSPRDTSSGWRNLDISGKETPVSKGLKENAVVAFAIQTDDDAAEPNFEVEFARFPDEDDGDE